MKKNHFYLVSANFNLKRKWYSTDPSNPDSNSRVIKVFEIFKIEQEADETDEVFYASLLVKIEEKINMKSEEWLEKNNNGCSEESELFWRKDGLKVSNVSKV